MTHPRSAAFAILTILALCVPATAAGKPGVHFKPLKHPKYEVRPDEVVVGIELRLVGKQPARDINVKLSLTAVGARRPFDTDTIHIGEFNAGDPNPLSFDLDVDAPIGRYKIRACMTYRYRARRERACRDGKEVSVIPPTWAGDVTASAPLHNRLGGSAIQGSSARATFTFEGPRGQELAYGATNPVRFYVDGTDPEGCKWSGSTGVSAIGDELLLSKDLLGYRFSPGTSFIPYAATADCPAPRADINMTLYSGPWLPGFPQTRSRSTDTSISGTNPVIPGLPGDFVWSLQAYE